MVIANDVNVPDLVPRTVVLVIVTKRRSQNIVRRNQRNDHVVDPPHQHVMRVVNESVQSAPMIHQVHENQKRRDVVNGRRVSTCRSVVFPR